MSIASDSAYQQQSQTMINVIETPLSDIACQTDQTVTRVTSSTWRQMLIVCAVLISAYLLNGEHAQAICNITTTIPAAAFTYRQLSDRTTRMFVYKATLFYWSIHGILIAFDSIFSEAFGYFFGKFILLVVLFLNVIYQYDIDKDRQQQSGEQRVSASCSRLGARSMSHLAAVSQTDATQFSHRYPFGARSVRSNSSMATAMSIAGSPTFTAFLPDTYDYDQSTHTHPVSDVNSNDSESKLILSEDHRKAGDQPDKMQTYEIQSPPTSFRENKCLVTIPAHRIIFKELMESVTISATSIYGKSIFWALKTNAIDRLIAQPTYGVLDGGCTVHIKLALNEFPSKEHDGDDRIVLEYWMYDENVMNLEQMKMHLEELPHRKRKLLTIEYQK